MVSYGGGANSTALLVGLHQHHIPVDLILFADTGAEHPHTYAYLDIMDRWLKDHGMPPITRVYKTTRDGKRLTLEQECLQSGTLPSMAYGFKRCSLKHKIGPQDKFCNRYLPCRKVWAAGKRVVKFIGYDAGESYRSDKVLLGGLPASHRRCGPAPAGQILLLLLPQHEGGGDHPPAGPPPGPVPKGHRLGRQRPPQFENGPGPGP